MEKIITSYLPLGKVAHAKIKRASHRSTQGPLVLETTVFRTLQSALALAETAGVARPLFRAIVEPLWRRRRAIFRFSSSSASRMSFAERKLPFLRLERDGLDEECYQRCY
jgi:hypothetical protein